jgi:hypothetical protein
MGVWKLMKISTDEPHVREEWTKRGGAWERNSGGLH